MQLLSLAAVGLAFSAVAAAPNLTRVSPLAAVPGETTVVTLFGDNLSGAVDLWTSFPCEVAPAKSSHSTAFELKLPVQETAGLGAIRLITTNGLSSLHLLLIDPLPTVQGSSTNHSPASAQLLQEQVAVDGWCEELRSDFYRIHAKKVERIAIEVVAQRLGSPLDPLVRVLDAQGRELAANDDAPGLGSDARLDFRCPSSADYLIEVRDTRHSGGPRHHYRLRIGKRLPSPLPFIASKELVTLTSAPKALPSVSEREPNDTSALAHRIQLPAEVTGQFNKSADRDVYEFSVGKGDRIVFSGQSRSLGSPGDLYLQLQTTNGTKIAGANATSEDEGMLTNRFNEDGLYRLVVEELNHLGGQNFHYKVAMRTLEPGFALRTETDRISGPAGDSIEIEVHTTRRDYDGPIQLRIEGLPQTFTATNAIIAARTNATKVWIKLPEDLALGDAFHFSIIGTTNSNGSDTSERVSTLPALRAAFPALRYQPMELDGAIALSVSESKSSNPKPPQKKRRK